MDGNSKSKNEDIDNHEQIVPLEHEEHEDGKGLSKLKKLGHKKKHLDQVRIFFVIMYI